MSDATLRARVLAVAISSASAASHIATASRPDPFSLAADDGAPKREKAKSVEKGERTWYISPDPSIAPSACASVVKTPSSG